MLAFKEAGIPDRELTGRFRRWVHLIDAIFSNDCFTVDVTNAELHCYHFHKVVYGNGTGVIAPVIAVLVCVRLSE